MEQAEINRRIELFARSVYSRLSLLTVKQLERRHLWLLWSRGKFEDSRPLANDMVVQNYAGANIEFGIRSYASSPGGFAVTVAIKQGVAPDEIMSINLKLFVKDVLHTAVRAIGIDPSLQSPTNFRLDFADYELAIRMLCFFDEIVLSLLGLMHAGKRPHIDPSDANAVLSASKVLRSGSVKCLLDVDGKLVR